MVPTGADAPHGGAEDEHGQQKKDSGDFEPQGSAYVRKRAQETRDAAGQTTAGAAGCLSGGAAHRTGRCNRLRGLYLAACLGVSGKALAGHAAGDSQTDAEGAAYGLGSHP